MTAIVLVVLFASWCEQSRLIVFRTPFVASRSERCGKEGNKSLDILSYYHKDSQQCFQQLLFYSEGMVFIMIKLPTVRLLSVPLIEWNFFFAKACNGSRSDKMCNI